MRLITRVASSSALAGYFVVGASVILFRSLSDSVGELTARLRGAGWVLEVQSGGTWHVVRRGMTLDGGTARLSELVRKHSGRPGVFDKHHWRLREVDTGDVLPVEALCSEACEEPS